MIESAFSTYVYDGVRTLEEHWDTMINAIQIGTLPDIYDLGEYRSHIEVRFSGVVSPRWSNSPFRDISNLILIELRNSARSKRDKKAGLRKSGPP